MDTLAQIELQHQQNQKTPNTESRSRSCSPSSAFASPIKSKPKHPEKTACTGIMSPIRMSVASSQKGEYHDPILPQFRSTNQFLNPPEKWESHQHVGSSPMKTPTKALQQNKSESSQNMKKSPRYVCDSQSTPKKKPRPSSQASSPEMQFMEEIYKKAEQLGLDLDKMSGFSQMLNKELFSGAKAKKCHQLSGDPLNDSTLLRMTLNKLNLIAEKLQQHPGYGEVSTRKPKSSPQRHTPTSGPRKPRSSLQETLSTSVPGKQKNSQQNNMSTSSPGKPNSPPKKKTIPVEGHAPNYFYDSKDNTDGKSGKRRETRNFTNITHETGTAQQAQRTSGSGFKPMSTQSTNEYSRNKSKGTRSSERRDSYGNSNLISQQSTGTEDSPSKYTVQVKRERKSVLAQDNVSKNMVKGTERVSSEDPGQESSTVTPHRKRRNRLTLNPNLELPHTETRSRSKSACMAPPTPLRTRQQMSRSSKVADLSNSNENSTGIVNKAKGSSVKLPPVSYGESIQNQLIHSQGSVGQGVNTSGPPVFVRRKDGTRVQLRTSK